jgi:hypothetical protein
LDDQLPCQGKVYRDGGSFRIAPASPRVAPAAVTRCAQAWQSRLADSKSRHASKIPAGRGAGTTGKYDLGATRHNKVVAVGKATSICSSQWAKPRSASMVVRAWVENHGMEESSHWCSRADALVWHQLRLEDRVAIARDVDVGPPGVVTAILKVKPFQESSHLKTSLQHGLSSE